MRAGALPPDCSPLLLVKGLHLAGLSFLMVTESTPTSQNKEEGYLFVYS